MLALGKSGNESNENKIEMYQLVKKLNNEHFRNENMLFGIDRKKKKTKKNFQTKINNQNNSNKIFEKTNKNHQKSTDLKDEKAQQNISDSMTFENKSDEFENDEYQVSEESNSITVQNNSTKKTFNGITNTSCNDKGDKKNGEITNLYFTTDVMDKKSTKINNQIREKCLKEVAECSFVPKINNPNPRCISTKATVGINSLKDFISQIILPEK